MTNTGNVLLAMSLAIETIPTFSTSEQPVPAQRLRYLGKMIAHLLCCINQPRLVNYNQDTQMSDIIWSL